MAKEDYPSSEAEFGQYIVIVCFCSVGDPVYKTAEKHLLDVYERTKREYEINTDEVWCLYGSPEITWNPPHDSDHLCVRSSLTIRWTVVGRSFYIKRHFCKSVYRFKKHAFKSNVPKRKRGRSNYSSQKFIQIEKNPKNRYNKEK